MSSRHVSFLRVMQDFPFTQKWGFAMKLRQIPTFAALFGAALFVASMLARPAFADNPLVGTWKLVSWVVEDLETKKLKQPFGQHPPGLLIFTPEMRFIVLFTAEGRTGGQTEADRSRNFMTSYATAGKYRVEGSKYFATVEVAQNPALVGTGLTRDFKIEGNRLTVLTAPEKSVLMNTHMAQVTAVYERVTQ